MSVKFCKFCNKEHPLTKEFWVTDNSRKYGLGKCKKKKAEWRNKNKEVLAKKELDRYYADHEESKRKRREYRRDNIEKIKSQKRKWNKKTGYPTKYARKKRREDLQFRIRANLRSRLWQAIKKDKAGSAVKNLGCSVQELMKYIESKFSSGMSWKNYGKRGWHIDHIKPLSGFDLTKSDQLKQACHYTNLQPLWWQENLSKGSS